MLRHSAAAFLKLRADSQQKYRMNDPSSLDWVTLKVMAKRGWKQEALEHALWHSPDLEKRKAGHAENYVIRTLDKLAADPDVLVALHRRSERQAKERDRARRPHDERVEPGRTEQSPPSSAAGHKPTSSGDQRQTERPTQGNTSGSRKPDISLEAVEVHAMGRLDREAVGWIIEQTRQSKASQRQWSKAAWALTQDTQRWHPCKAEYLKELARCRQVKGAHALTPHIDAEIAVKLRLAGFSKNQITKILRAESPFMQVLDSGQQHTYLTEGIAPIVNHRQTWSQLKGFNEMRMIEAQQLSEGEREAFLKERRLEQLRLATTPERWREQMAGPNGGRLPEPEREIEHER